MYYLKQKIKNTLVSTMSSIHLLSTQVLFRPLLIAGLLICAFSQTAFAEIRYIDDTLRIPLRSGASTDHRILAFLNSGTKVDQQYLSEDDEEWAFVTVGDNKEGWVQVRYLKNTPAAKELLQLSQQELSKYKQSNREQNETIKTLKGEIKELKSQLDDLSKHSNKSDKELEHIKDISKNAIRLDHNNTQLLEENEQLKIIQEENEQQIIKLKSSQQNQGMIYGVLAVILGIVLGLILPKMKSRKSDGWA